MDLTALIFGYVLGLVIGLVAAYLATTSSNQLNVRDARLERLNTLNNEGYDDKTRFR